MANVSLIDGHIDEPKEKATEPKRCKYCDRLPAVRHLQKQLDQLRRLKVRRDSREYWKR